MWTKLGQVKAAKMLQARVLVGRKNEMQVIATGSKHI
jgi:hypothetical protein